MKLTKSKLKQIIREEIFKIELEKALEKEGLFEGIKSEKQKDDVVDEIAPALMGLARGAAGVGRAVAKGAGAAAKGVGKLFKSKVAKKAGKAGATVALSAAEKALEKKKSNKIKKEADLGKTAIPADVKKFMDRFIGKMRSKNIPRQKQRAILYNVVKGMGITPQELTQYTQRVKRGL